MEQSLAILVLGIREKNILVCWDREQDLVMSAPLNTSYPMECRDTE